MSGFEKASAAFRAHANKVLGTNDLQFGPPDDGLPMDQTVGKAWAFFAAPSSNPQKLVRGWAVADGRVVTTEQNFGILLEEAGLWATPPKDQENLPALVAWSLGNEWMPNRDPKVQLAPDGSGTVTFDLRYQQSGGGGSLGPMMKYDVVVTVAKDHSATVKMTKQ